MPSSLISLKAMLGEGKDHYSRDKEAGSRLHTNDRREVSAIAGFLVRKGNINHFSAHDRVELAA